MGNKTCLALFQRRQLPQMDNIIKEWILVQRLRKLASLLHKLCLPHPPSSPDLFLESCPSRKELSHKLIFPSPEISFLVMEVLPALKR